MDSMQPSYIGIRSFYQMALAFKHDKEVTNTLETERLLRETDEAWKKATAEVIRAAIPLSHDEMLIFPTVPHQYQEEPRNNKIYQVDCVVNPLLFNQDMTPMERMRQPGVIRVQLYWSTEEDTPGWKILRYKVVVDGDLVEFDDPQLAFLAAYNPAWHELP